MGSRCSPYELPKTIFQFSFLSTIARSKYECQMFKLVSTTRPVIAKRSRSLAKCSAWIKISYTGIILQKYIPSVNLLKGKPVNESMFLMKLKINMGWFIRLQN